MRTDRRPRMNWLARVVIAAALTGGVSAVAAAQRTDVVTLANGDHITGEIQRLERGRLMFKTDDAGTLYLEWDKVVSVLSSRLMEVMTDDGRRFLGALGRAEVRRVLVMDGPDGVALSMQQVTVVTPIGRSFWSKLDGSIDAGFSYTQSSGVAQLNLNSSTLYRQPAFAARLAASFTQTENDDGSGKDDRGWIDLSYLKYAWQRWFFMSAAKVETNQSLGLVLRTELGAAIGPRLVNSNRGQLAFGGGLAVNDERGVEVESTRNLEALLMVQTSYFTYDRPRTNLDLSLMYYPSLTNAGRQRVQFDAAVKREFWKDLFAGFNVYNTFDSRPPNPEASSNDFGAVLSLGWSY